MIREATLIDISQIIELLKEFFDTADIAKISEGDIESSTNTITNLIKNNNMAIIVMDIDNKIVGCLGVVVIPFYFNSKHLIGHEFFWFVSEKHRGTKESLRLFNSAEEWAKNHGAKSMMMTSLAYNINSLRNFYRRKKYVELETSFIRKF